MLFSSSRSRESIQTVSCSVSCCIVWLLLFISRFQDWSQKQIARNNHLNNRKLIIIKIKLVVVVVVNWMEIGSTHQLGRR